ncbi:hypothetical protein HanIR_Chr15g0730041 [Helianthus annuus]|nr:hypothetical protein HanIR_Chr15g0730041 [Helianthus annuus]
MGRLKIREAERINEFAAKSGEVQSIYKSLGSTLEEDVVRRKFSNSMSNRYLPMVSLIKKFAKIKNMKYEDLDMVGRLKAYEERNKFNVNFE